MTEDTPNPAIRILKLLQLREEHRKGEPAEFDELVKTLGLPEEAERDVLKALYKDGYLMADNDPGSKQNPICAISDSGKRYLDRTG